MTNAKCDHEDDAPLLTTWLLLAMLLLQSSLHGDVFDVMGDVTCEAVELFSKRSAPSSVYQH